jgi:hypothetical protein
VVDALGFLSPLLVATAIPQMQAATTVNSTRTTTRRVFGFFFDGLCFG